MRHTTSTTEQLDIRGLQYNVRRWGAADAPRLFLLHGRMDSSATFQFVVEALRHDWQVIAPDWRGFGGSTWLGQPYWFPDYYADLGALLAHYAPEEPVRLVGHSLGGNVAGIYAGLYPERVAQLAILDVLGLRPVADVDAPSLLQKWMAAQAEAPRMRVYPDHAALARRLCAANARLTPERADFLARHVGRVRGDGRVEMGCDPWHKLPSPFPYRVEDAMACWRRVRAPVLLLIGDEGYLAEGFGDDLAELRRRAECFPDVRQVTISGAGHNIQHDQPEQVAAALESFFLREPT